MLKNGSRWVAALLVAVALLCAPVSAVGTVTTAYSAIGTKYTKITITWTSSAGGAVSGNAFTLPAGDLVQIQFVPNGGGTQPTDLYDVTLVDNDNVDVLNGLGANLSNSTGTILQWNPEMVSDSSRTLDLVVANAGNAKSGTVYLWVRK